jgi:hypothetical protein
MLRPMQDWSLLRDHIVDHAATFNMRHAAAIALLKIRHIAQFIKTILGAAMSLSATLRISGIATPRVLEMRCGD